MGSEAAQVSFPETAMTASLRALLAGAIDYAGLFPPAQLPLEEAFANYLEYRRSPESWMLGRFVIPAARLAELVQFEVVLMDIPGELAFSLLGRGGEKSDNFQEALDSDL